MTKAEQRVQIAKDVIAQILTRRIKAVRGSYITLEGVAHGLNERYDVQALVRSARSCEVCAKGSILVAAVDRFDRLHIRFEELNTVAASRDGGSYLHRWFARRALNLIEYVYETEETAANLRLINVTPDEKKAAKKWRSTYRKAAARLDAIMRNIIANGGNFNINKVPRPRKTAINARSAR